MKRPVGVTLRRVSGVFVFALAIIISQFSGMQFVHAVSTDVWTGTAGDGKFSTVTNWQGGVAPVNGDTLSFDATSLTASASLTNDLTNLSVGGINFTGTNSGYYSYTIGGSNLTVTGNISRSGASVNINLNIILGADITIIGGPGFNSSNTIDTQGHSISVQSSGDVCSRLPQLTGSGSLSVAETANSSLSLSAGGTGYTGAIDVTSGTVYVVGPTAIGSASGITVSGAGSLSLVPSADNQTWAVPLTLSGTGSLSVQHDSTVGCMGGPATEVYTANQTGAVTLLSDFKYSGIDNLKVTGTYTDNSHTFSVVSGASGSLILPTGTSTAPIVTNTYSDSQPTVDVNVGYNETDTLDGQRQTVSVANGGTLMGNGTADSIYLYSGGIIAPGHSPGKLTATQTLTLSAGSIYQAQIQNATAGGYDQIQVSDPSRTTGQDVQIDPAAILDVSLYPGYNINKGDKFTIINNLQPSTQLVLGTFSGMPEGAQFTVGGITFSISYVGGDGNDVVLTALSTGAAPKIPNTGARPLKLANPAAVVGLGISAAAILFMLARRRFNS